MEQECEKERQYHHEQRRLDEKKQKNPDPYGQIHLVIKEKDDAKEAFLAFSGRNVKLSF